MTDEQRAVALILGRLHAEGLDWYRRSNAPGVAFYTTRLKATYTVVDPGRVADIRWRPASQFPSRHIAFLSPPDRDPEPLLAIWCRWNFEVNPAKCGFYIGLWAKIGADHNFVGFRFETPEDGDQHDFYHCQPCRNLGDQAHPDSRAVAISEFVPTLGLHAENSAELALNIVLAMRGKRGLEKFRRSLMEAEAEARNSEILKRAFARLRSLPVAVAA